MNPFDAMNSDTSKNSDGAIKNKKNITKSKRTSHQVKNNISSNKSKNYNKAPESHQSFTKPKENQSLNNDKVIEELSKQYSTDRLNMYDIIRLKLLQKVNGMKSRSQLVDNMIKQVKPVYLNSSAKKKQYQSLFKYALVVFKINKKFR